MSNLKTKYEDEIVKKLADEFDIKNVNRVPRLTKIVVNMGTKDRLRDKKQREKLIDDFAAITGQKPKVQPAKISVAGFGIRAGMPVGLTATLRGERMYDFFERLTTIVLPRLRDFRGVSKKSFDKAGNYSLGIKEYTVFPEIDLATIDKPHGVQMTFVTSANSKKEAESLLKALGMPFEKEEN